jgi:hypothetical protein
MARQVTFTHTLPRRALLKKLMVSADKQVLCLLLNPNFIAEMQELATGLYSEPAESSLNLHPAPLKFSSILSPLAVYSLTAIA